MNKAVVTFFLLFFFMANASAAVNLLVLGEDGSSDTIACDSRVFKRVLAALNDEMHNAGFDMYDETAVARDHYLVGKCQRSTEQLIELAKSVYRPPLDVLVVFEVYTKTVEKDYMTKVQSQVMGRMLDIKTGRRLGNFEMTSPNEWTAPTDCDRVCTEEIVGRYSKYLAQDLGAVLSEKLAAQTGEPGSAQGNNITAAVNIMLRGFSVDEQMLIEEQLEQLPDYRNHRFNGGKTRAEIWYETDRKISQLRRDCHKIVKALDSKASVKVVGNSLILSRPASNKPRQASAILTPPVSTSDVHTDSDDGGDLGLGIPTVTWAGFAMAGSMADAKKRYPYSSSMQSKIVDYTRAHIPRLNPEHYQLITDRKGDRRQGESLSMALVLEDELVFQRKLAGVYQVVLEMSAELLVFDFDGEQKSIIASFPVHYPVYIDTFDHKPSKKEVASLVKRYWFGGLSGEAGQQIKGLLNVAVETMEAVEIKEKYSQECGIGKVTISGGAKKVMADSFRGNLDAAERYLARKVSRNLSAQRGIAMVPYRADAAITKMALTFNGERVTSLLKFPEPDYLVDVELANLVWRNTIADDDERIIQYGARMNLRFIDAFDEAFLEASMAEKISPKFLLSQPVVNDWRHYNEVIDQLGYKVIAQMSKPDRQWLKENKLPLKNTIKGFKKAAQGFDKCQ